ncbi:MAG TPA: hypothetical protein VFH51_04525 [Myxococcota bacterium]|nr:hypothetical protein [Myxococcota bacterium]
MLALNLMELEKRWWPWRELDAVRRSMGLIDTRIPTFSGADDAPLSSRPEDLLWSRSHRLD